MRKNLVTQQGYNKLFTRLETLKREDFFPEIGDIVGYNDAFYEIDNIKETQLIAGRPTYNQSIICQTHLTRRSNIQIEPRQV